MGRSIDIYRHELIGAAFMVALGSTLHFAFDWSGGWKPLAIVAAVNESIWEHLKLAFWPGMLWATFARLPTKISRLEALAAKGFSLLITACLIVTVFVTYTTVLGRNLLVLDIGTFVLAIFAGQLFCAWLLTRTGALLRPLIGPGIFCLLLQMLAYSTLTFYPANHWLFIEAQSGRSGID